MISGTVKFYNTTKGFGFIAPDGGSRDAFVQAGVVERAGLSSLGEGQKIFYDIENGRGWPHGGDQPQIALMGAGLRVASALKSFRATYIHKENWT